MDPSLPPSLNEEQARHLFQQQNMEIAGLRAQLQQALSGSVPSPSLAPPPHHAPFPPSHRVPKPKSFSGALHTNVGQWLFALQLYFEGCNISDPIVQAQIAATLLEGDALVWWQSVRRSLPIDQPLPNFPSSSC